MWGNSDENLTDLYRSHALQYQTIVSLSLSARLVITNLRYNLSLAAALIYKACLLAPLGNLFPRIHRRTANHIPLLDLIELPQFHLLAQLQTWRGLDMHLLFDRFPLLQGLSL